MARIRTIKPEFFRHRRLYLAEKETGLPLRIAFAGLWTCCDREGRFRWEPDELKLDCLPYDDVDFARVLDALAAGGFIVKYEADGRTYGAVPSWQNHQVINQREAKSKIPEPSELPEQVHAHASTCTHGNYNAVNITPSVRETVYARDGDKCLRCGATSDLTVDHIFPQCMGGTHALTNLRTLCRACNSRRPVQGQGLIDDLAKDGLTLNDMQRMCMHVHARGEGKGREGKGISRAADASPHDVLWKDGVSYVRDRGGKTESNARSLIGKWVKASTPETVIDLIARAQAEKVIEPVAFIEACLKRRAPKSGADPGGYRPMGSGAGG